jgi:hypothetical protein
VKKISVDSRKHVSSRDYSLKTIIPVGLSPLIEKKVVEFTKIDANDKLISKYVAGKQTTSERRPSQSGDKRLAFFGIQASNQGQFVSFQK